ncbi:hypothetical protein AB0886_05255 [Streptomyces sp. NPDC024062]|uniref:hypothetical protein n=1 Tax=unclassified Streptomyces TaxID=2593676 RepID=UPI003438DAE9
MNTRYRHPLATHAAGAILGHRRDGRPIYAIAGGDGTGEGGAPAAPAAPAPAAPAAPPAAPAPVPAAPVAPAAPAPGTPAAPPQGEPQDVAGLPQWAQDHIRSLRTEAADYRTRAQAQPQAPAQPPAVPAAEGDVSRLPQWAQRIVTDSQTTARQAAVQAAVYTTAATAGADPAALLDSTSAMVALAAVDPADPAAVTAAITAAVTANPRLAAKATGPARGGTDFGGTPPAEQRPANLQDAVAARLAAS